MARGNKIVDEYIEAISKLKLNEYEKHDYGFILGFSMFLAKERILENKDFYNKLFKKYNIDYEIKDPQ